MRTAVHFAAALPLAACVQVSSTETERFSAASFGLVQVEAERGTIVFSGVDGADDVTAAITSWGDGSSKDRADEHANTNSWAITTDDGIFYVLADSPHPRAGLDVEVTAPPVVDTILETGEGDVYVDNAHGSTYATGYYIGATNLVGDADLYALRDGMDAEIFPYQTAEIAINSDGGDVSLSLPYGLDYDLEIFGDADYGMVITDLGFDTLYLAPDYVHATRGSGSVHVTGAVYGGEFILFEAF